MKAARKTKNPSAASATWYVGYSVTSSLAARLAPRMKGLRADLLKSGLLVDHQAYIGFILFTSILALAVILPFTVIIGISGLAGSTFSALSVPIGLFGSAIVFLLLYLYPKLKTAGRKGKMDSSLLFTASFMSILAGSGMSPDKIFRRLAVTSNLAGIQEEARLVVRDIDLLGSDFLTALENAVRRSPSRLYTELLEGLISTIHSGGDLGGFLYTKTEDMMAIEHDAVKGFLNKLAMLADAVLSVIVVLPLMIIIIFATTSVIPVGILSNPFVLYLFIYVMMPLFGFVFLIILGTSRK